MLANLLNTLFPRNCLACNTILLRSEEKICLLCREELPYTHEHLVQENTSYHKFYGRVPIESAAALLFYSKEGKVQQLIHNLKYYNHPELSYFLGSLYAQQIAKTNLLEDVTSIIPVPLHKRKLKKRGYNQVDGFAKAFSEQFNITINQNLLIKREQTASQTTKTRFQRKNKKKEVFDLNLSHLACEYNHFLLLDDILTTGNTLEACCRQLLKIPNTKITILCLARSI